MPNHTLSILGLMLILAQTSNAEDALLSKNNLEIAKKNGAVLHTTGNICHPINSPYYDRITRVTDEYDSLTTCLEENKGSRIPSNLVVDDSVTQSINDSIFALESTKNQALKENNAVKALESEREITELQNLLQKQKENADALNDYLGFSWGLSIGMLWDDQPYINEAAIKDGKVQIISESSFDIKILLEAHKLFHVFKGDQNAIGFFIATELGNTEEIRPFQSFIIGPMFSYRSAQGQDAWNIGVGALLDTRKKLLVGNLENGDDTSITDERDLYKYRESLGIAAVFSTNF